MYKIMYIIWFILASPGIIHIVLPEHVFEREELSLNNAILTGDGVHEVDDD
jgi:hypothetical protein